jgi:hypothetical protein
MAMYITKLHLGSSIRRAGGKTSIDNYRLTINVRGVVYKSDHIIEIVTESLTGRQE